jgi:hypothetical protein
MRKLRAAGVMGWLLASACSSSPPPPPNNPPPPSPPPARSIDSRVLAYMECAECREGELEAVTTARDTAVPPLQQILIAGPDAHRLSVVEHSLRATLTPTPSDAAIQFQLASFRRMYETRAIRALSIIATGDAKTALCRARATVTTYERAALDSAIARAGGQCP